MDPIFWWLDGLPSLPPTEEGTFLPPNASPPSKPSSLASLSPAPEAPLSEEQKRTMRQHQQAWLKASLFFVEAAAASSAKPSDAKWSQLPTISRGGAERVEDEPRYVCQRRFFWFVFCVCTKSVNVFPPCVLSFTSFITHKSVALTTRVSGVPKQDEQPSLCMCLVTACICSAWWW